MEQSIQVVEQKTVAFYEDEITAVRVRDGTIYIPIRPICDLIGVAREALMAIGCIQAQLCHTGRCPTGVATQDKWLARGLDPTHKSARLANYMLTLRKDLKRLSHACGVSHPALVPLSSLEMLQEGLTSVPVAELFGYQNSIEKLGASDRQHLGV